MHATSAVAVAVVALNAAGVMAIPMGNLYARGTGASVAPAASSAAAGGHAAGAATTTTVTYHPRPTACKAGEKPSAERKHKSKKTPAGTGAEHPGASHEAKAGVVARAADPVATGTAAASSVAGAPAPTAPATHGKKGKGNKHTGPHIATKTGADGKVTVTVFHKGTSTKCYAPTGAPGTGAKEATGASKHAHKAGNAATEQAPVSAKTEKKTRDLSFDDEDIYAREFEEVLPRSAPAATATSAPAGAHAAAGAATTTTILYPARPTACKAGETPSVQHKAHKNKKEKSATGAGAHSEAHTEAKPVVRRAETAAPTSTAAASGSSAPGAPAPTAPATHGKKHKHHVPHTATKTGVDGKVTVKVYQPSSTTACYAPTGVPAAPGAPAANKASKAAAKPAVRRSAVVDEAVELLERYFSELDELD